MHNAHTRRIHQSKINVQWSNFKEDVHQMTSVMIDVGQTGLI